LPDCAPISVTRVINTQGIAEMSIDNLKLRTKTLIPLVVMALVVVAMVVFGALKLSSISEKARDIIERRDVGAADMTRASQRMLEAPYSAFGGLLYDPDSPEGKLAAQGFPKSIADANSFLDEAAKLIPEKKTDIAQLKDRFGAIAVKAKRPFEIGEALPALSVGRKLTPEQLDQFAEGALLMADIDIATRALTDDIKAFNKNLIAENAQAAQELSAQSSEAMTTMAVVGGVATFIAGAFALWLSSAKIAGPLARLAQRMGALAKGDLTVQIDGQSRRDEVGDMARAVLVFKDAAIENARLGRAAAEHATQAEGERGRNEQAQRQAIAQERAVVASSIGAALAKLAAKDLTYRMPSDIPDAYRKLQADFNEAIAQLEEAMRSVTGSTDAIQSGTREISTASDDLSRRTEQQAASLEETAAALDEITATVKKSSEGAMHARQVVTAADADAKKTTAVVREAVDAMAAIAKSSQQITQIIGVIDEIAFQTNLLALNAGVEAARAGDAGRGFAVVASEVRALAQRSADAAKEIKGLISTSTTQVDHGVKLVAETGKSLERIMAQVTEINDVVGAIAAGAKEQATALQEVNSAINQMDQATQQNAAMVEQSTAASHSLSQETTQLSGLVGQFQIGRASGDEPMRRELKKAAPHAFRPPAKAAARAPAPSQRPARTAPKQVVNGTLVGGDAESWEEF
jgi:methyl-accepting chemotaxis protein